MHCREVKAEAVSLIGSYSRNPGRHKEGPEVVGCWLYFEVKPLMLSERERGERKTPRFLT